MIILDSERLYFRPHEPADLEDFCAMEMDAEVRRYVGGYPRSREAAEHRFPSSRLAQADTRLGVWATVLKSSDQYIGRCGLYRHIDPSGQTVPREAAISFYIARSFWGNGFATEAARAFIEFGWQQLQLSRIVTTVEVGNAASVRILEKTGFDLVATEQGPRSFFKFALENPAQPKQNFLASSNAIES